MSSTVNIIATAAAVFLSVRHEPMICCKNTIPGILMPFLPACVACKCTKAHAVHEIAQVCTQYTGKSRILFKCVGRGFGIV